MSRKLIALSVLLAVAVSACGKKEEENKDAAAPAVVAVPTTDDSNAWKQYGGGVAAKPVYQEVDTDRTILYFLPSVS